MWDNVNELQELTNITTRNIEEIYDKDILRLQNFQNLVEGDLKKMKKDITGNFHNIVSLISIFNSSRQEFLAMEPLE